jgi:LmbE family N-acetylglucosaminyl deacetylase
MKLSFAQDRVLAVMAHPDDAELLCAGTLARARADGAAIAICVLCAGDKGLGETERNADLRTVRRDEAAEAAKLIGAESFFCSVPDGELMDDAPTRQKVIEVYRRFKPGLVLAHAAGDYHSDHRAASAVAEAASWYCASRGHVTDSPALPAPPALWWCDTVNMNGFEPAFFVNVTAQIELKQRMLSCHRSQLRRERDADFAHLAELMLRQCQVRGAQAGVNAAEAFRSHNAFKRARAW